ncbi:unnamed protein product [marine sediment metagenome]|uniref:Nucleotidyl transferase domain-containing protein n=1 Tax=marine sediment metagenome TaxID=412755 RepID=X1MQ92_9ZZZZ
MLSRTVDLSDTPSIAVILAAGKGIRFGNKSVPKPLEKVNGKFILTYQLEQLNEVAERVFIVVGYLANNIIRAVGKKFKNLEVNYLFQKNQNGMAAALSLARDQIKDPFILTLGDIFCPAFDFSELHQRGAAGIVVVKSLQNEMDKRHAAISVNDDKRIISILEKPSFRTIGFYAFTPVIFEAIDKTHPSPLRGELEISDSIGELVRMGEIIVIKKTRLPEVNLTYPVDLSTCEEILDGIKHTPSYIS